METDYEKFLIQTIKTITGSLAPNLKINLTKEGDQYRINIDSDINELLVGHRGENIKAIQHVIRVIVHKNYPEDKTHFLLDVGEYKKNRESLINKIIPIIAQKEIIEMGNSVILTGLNGYERKLIHTLLVDVKGVITSSVGEESSRKLIIRPSEDSAGLSSMESSKIIDIEKYNTDQ
jgi:spoIIIJ-associated protein